MTKPYLDFRFFLILFSLIMALNIFLPSFNYARPFMPSDWLIGGGGKHAKIHAYSYIFSWVIPGIIVLCFAYFSNLRSRIIYNWPSWVLIGIAIYTICIIILFYLAKQIPGGGASFALRSYLSYLSLPSRLLLLFGTVGFFMSLRRKNCSNA